ncbi:MAG: hypothetical protein JWO95_522 [Verrucomicrobiales bacterium]|nr:hypothetical protein [Verrucomicrobiales bacterium]
MALPLLPDAPALGNTSRTAPDGTDQHIRHLPRAGVGNSRTIQRTAASLSKVRILPGPDPVRELLHDRDLSHPGTLHGLDLGPLGDHCNLCRARVALAALRIDAI